MAESRDDALLAVIRTPKSASTSLASIVLQAFPGARRFILPNTLNPEIALSGFQRLRHLRHAARVTLNAHGTIGAARVFDLVNREGRSGDLLTGGHIDFDTCRLNTARKVRFITLVRNPIDRVISEYSYLRAGHARKWMLAKVDSSIAAKTASRYSLQGYLDFLLEHRHAFGDIACRHLGIAPGTDIAAHFAAHAYHFGTVDDLAAFADGLSRKTKRPVQVPHLNPTGKTATLALTREIRRKAERLYENDLALYEWCRRSAPGTATRPAPLLQRDAVA
jgi:hypothetical protein